jgi:hypothetical protein
VELRGRSVLREERRGDPPRVYEGEAENTNMDAPRQRMRRGTLLAIERVLRSLLPILNSPSWG